MADPATISAGLTFFGTVLGLWGARKQAKAMRQDFSAQKKEYQEQALLYDFLYGDAKSWSTWQLGEVARARDARLNFLIGPQANRPKPGESFETWRKRTFNKVGQKAQKVRTGQAPGGSEYATSASDNTPQSNSEVAVYQQKAAAERARWAKADPDAWVMAQMEDGISEYRFQDTKLQLTDAGLAMDEQRGKLENRKLQNRVRSIGEDQAQANERLFAQDARNRQTAIAGTILDRQQRQIGIRDTQLANQVQQADYAIQQTDVEAQKIELRDQQLDIRGQQIGIKGDQLKLEGAIIRLRGQATQVGLADQLNKLENSLKIEAINAKLHRANAAEARRLGREVADAGSRRLWMHQFATRQALGDRRAKQAASGLVADAGSALAVRKGMKAYADMEALDIRRKTNSQVLAYVHQSMVELDREEQSNIRSEGIVVSIGHVKTLKGIQKDITGKQQAINRLEQESNELDFKSNEISRQLLGKDLDINRLTKKSQQVGRKNIVLERQSNAINEQINRDRRAINRQEGLIGLSTLRSLESQKRQIQIAEDSARADVDINKVRQGQTRLRRLDVATDRKRLEFITAHEVFNTHHAARTKACEVSHAGMLNAVRNKHAADTARARAKRTDDQARAGNAQATAVVAQAAANVGIAAANLFTTLAPKPKPPQPPAGS